MPNLPANWASTTLGAFCDLVNGRSFKPSDWSDAGLRIIRIQNLRNADAPYHRFAGEVAERHRVSSGDLLFAWSGTPGTSFGAHIWSRGDAVLNQHIFKVSFDDEIANAEFLRIAIKATLPFLMKQAKGGAGLKHLTRSVVEGISIPLPPRLEQNRIVSALAGTAGRVGLAKAELATLVKRIPLIERQVLVGAITGSLLHVSADRSDQAAISEEDLTVLPIRAVGDLQIGRQRSPDVHEGPSMRPYLRVANVLDDYIDATDVMSMNFSTAEFDRYRLVPGDILVNEGQSLELVGRAAMFRGEPPDVCFTNTLIRFRAGPLVDPEYALLVFRAYQHTGRFREIARITTNLAHISMRRFAELEFPLRPLAQQREIVRIARNLIAKIRESANTLAQMAGEAQELIGAFETAALSGRLSRQSAHEKAPVVLLREKAARGKPTREKMQPFQSMTVDRTNKMPTINLVDALARSGTALDGQELFDAAGYPEDAAILQVEQFFLELRASLVEGRIKRTMADDERFSLTEPKR